MSTCPGCNTGGIMPHVGDCPHRPANTTFAGLPEVTKKTVTHTTEVIDIYPHADNVEIRVHHTGKWPTANLHWYGSDETDPPTATVTTLWTRNVS